MEYIKKTKDLPPNLKKLLENNPQHEELILKSYNTAVKKSVKQMAYYIEQLKTSIKLNDGSLKKILEDLELDLQDSKQ